MGLLVKMKQNAGTNSGKPTEDRWKGRKRHAIVLAVMSIPVLLLALMLMPPSMPDLSESAEHERQFLFESWTEGDSIVILRHLERCDRADVPCLVGKDGLTARSTLVASELSDDFFQLGLGNADIYNSPLPRTDQTADLLFSTRSTDKQWLYDCRKEDTLLRDALSSKKPGRNLVLITHSTCIARFEDDLGFSSDIPEYGTAIFLSAEPRPKALRLLGFVDAEDWDRVFHFSRLSY